MAKITAERLGKIKRKYQTLNYKASAWCFDNGYKIYPIPSKKCDGKCSEFYIVIQRGRSKKVSDKIYKGVDAQNRIWEIYDWLYNKHSKK